MIPLFICTIEDPAKRSLCEELYLKHRMHLFGLARSILKDDALAEDAVQDVFLSLIEKDKLPAAADPRAKAFLSVCTEHKALDMLKKLRHFSDEELDEHTLVYEMPEGSGELAVAIERLPARYREVIMLYYYMGYSAKEIGMQFGLEQKSVLKRIERARDMLREALRED